MVAQREHPDREGAAAISTTRLALADAAFEPVADHAGAGPDAALGKIGAGRSEGALDLPPTDDPVGDLVESLSLHSPTTGLTLRSRSPYFSQTSAVC